MPWRKCLSIHPETASGRWSKYGTKGLISRSGVLSRTSSSATHRNRPSRFSRRTTDRPMGLGRWAPAWQKPRGYVFHKGFGLQAAVLRQMKMIQNYQMGKAFHIQEALLELRKNFEPAAGFRSQTTLNRGPGFGRQWAVDQSHRVIDYLHNWLLIKMFQPAFSPCQTSH